ncbi:tRNA lysidine(34) synthetase TilS [bacterium]|nr:tRNA lysidine(34) synthetase TilS [bacterium]|tara:strand:- start:1497 stop:2624 length:1128 start_codon:yes stop_codon:yes gene_type:complete
MIEIFKNFIEKYMLSDSKLLISVSGGVDSMVMLYIASNILKSNNLIVLNINHNTREQNIAEANLVKDFCNSNNLEFYSESINVPEVNFEENARNIRHSIYKEYIDRFKLDGVLLGHHQDDAVETFLYNLFKGSFLDGLSSLKERNLSLNIYRPLMSFSKKQIYKYALDNKITYLEDESNTDSKYSRNFLRLEVIPLIQSKFFNFSKQIFQKTQIFSELSDYLNKNLEDFISYKIVDTGFGRKLLKSDFLTLPSFMQYDLLKRLGLNLKSFNHFLELRKSFESSGFQLNFKKFNLYISSDHFLFSELSLDELADYYFESVKEESFLQIKQFSSGLKFNDKSFMKSKQVKSLPFYFRSGIPVVVEGEKIIKYIVKNI